MSKCSLDATPAKYGFATEADIVRLDRIVQAYKSAVGENKSLHGLMENLAINGIAKVKADAKTANIASGFLESARVEMNRLTGKNVSKEDFVLAILATTRGNRIDPLMTFFDQTEPLTGAGKLPKNIHEIAKDIQDLNPLGIAEEWKGAFTAEGTLNYNYALMQAKYGDIINSGRFKSNIMNGVQHGDVIDRVFLESIHTTWKDLEKHLAPNEKKKYTALTTEQISKMVDKSLSENDMIDTSDAINKEILTSMTTGWYRQLNTYLVKAQELGLDIEWNKNYVMPNIHSKADIVFKSVVEKMQGHIKSLKEGESVDPEITKKMIDQSIDAMAVKFMEVGDHQKTLGDDFFKQYGRDPNIDKLILKRYKYIVKAMYDSELIPAIKDEAGQIGVIGINLPSVTRKFTQRSFYFKDADNYFAYLMENNTRFKSAYAEGGEPQGSILASILMHDTDNISKDFSILQLFGSNPALTFRKYAPDQLDSPVSRELFTRFIQNQEGGRSLKNYIFPANTNAIKDVPVETQRAFSEMIKNPILDMTDFNKRFGDAFYETTWTGKSSNASDFEHGWLGLITQFPKVLISPSLFLTNTVLDTLQRSYKLGEVMANSMALVEGMKNTSHIFAMSFRYMAGGIARQDMATRFKPVIAKALKIEEKDITQENFVEVVQLLGAMKEYGMVYDMQNAIARSENTTNATLRRIQKFNKSPLVSALGGIPMEHVTFFQKMATNLRLHQIVKDTIDLKQKMNPIMETHLQTFRLDRNMVSVLDDIFDNALSTKKLGIMDLEKLQQGTSRTITEAEFRERLGSKYENPELKAKALQDLQEGIDLELKPYYEQQRINYNAKAKAEEGIVFNTLEEFMLNLPDKLKANQQKLRDIKTTKYINQKAFAFGQFVNNISDEVSYIFKDSGSMSQHMKSASPKDKIVTATLLHLKRFLTNSLEVEARQIERIQKTYGKGILGASKIASKYAQYSVVLTAGGALLNMINGLFNNEHEGFLAIGDTMQDDSLSDEEKLARVMGELTQSWMLGLPVGTHLRAVMDTVSRDNSLVESMAGILFAPFASTFTSFVTTTQSLVDSSLKDTKDMTYAQEKRHNENKKEKLLRELNLGLRLVPAFNLPLLKVMMNYGGEPLYREYAQMAQDGEKYQEVVDDLKEMTPLEQYANTARNYRGKPIVE
jgi:hypothetical protein